MKNPTEKGEEAKSREIEMETVGEARQFAFVLGLHDTQRIARELRERRGVEGRLIRDDETRQALRLVQRLLRHADIDDDRARRSLLYHNERGQDKAAFGFGPRAFGEPKLAQGLRRGEAAALAGQNVRRLFGLAQRRQHRGARQRHRLDADEADVFFANARASLERRRDL